MIRSTAGPATRGLPLLGIVSDTLATLIAPGKKVDVEGHNLMFAALGAILGFPRVETQPPLDKYRAAFLTIFHCPIALSPEDNDIDEAGIFLPVFS